MTRFGQRGFSPLIFILEVLIISVGIISVSFYIKSFKKNSSTFNRNLTNHLAPNTFVASTPKLSLQPQLTSEPTPKFYPHNLYSPWPTKNPSSKGIVDDVELKSLVETCQVILLSTAHSGKHDVILKDGSEKIFDATKEYDPNNVNQIFKLLNQNPERCGFKVLLPIE